MLTIKYIIENKEALIKGLKTKNFADISLVDKIVSVNEERKNIQGKHDDAQSKMNAIAKEIGVLFKEGKIDEANKAKEQTGQLKEEIKNYVQHAADIEKELFDLMVQLPNIPHESVPEGKTAEDNVIVRSGGNEVKLDENAKPHWDLAKNYNLIDFELGNKITGAGFPVYIGKGAKLQRALISYFLDKAIEAGYKEIIPPLMVNEDSGFGTCNLPDKEGQMYYVTEDNFYLIPTAEVPVTNLYRDVILDETDFPIKNVAYTPCFRREAGSYGKDVRGLNRLHQFDKVEIVQVQHPDKSYDTLEEMVNHVEGLVKSLGLPYRILRLCGGDMSFASALTYDFEVYAAAQKKWLEVSSVSNFENFQSNRLKLRFKDKESKKNILAHTLNGSALALPRIVAALLENNQTNSGIKVPDVLVPFTGFEVIE